MAANLQVLVDSLDEGMLIVSPEGVVRLVNQAARRFFPVVVGKRLAVEELMVQVAAVPLHTPDPVGQPAPHVREELPLRV